MPVEYRKGNLFNYKGNLAHGTNMQGVMGKGIAVEFKRRFPQMFSAYKQTCEAGKHLPGTIFAFKETLVGDFWIYNLCVKGHWRLKSESHVVWTSIKTMVEHLENNDQTEVAMPTIGCGLGGLSWEKQVKPFIEEIGSTTSCNLIIYLQE